MAAWELPRRTAPTPRCSAALGIAFAVLSSFVDYLFRLRVEGTLSEDGLAALFGSLQLWIGLFCVASSCSWRERLLNGSAAALPGAGAAVPWGRWRCATLVTPVLWPVHLLRLVETAVSYSILPVGIQLLYAAVPDEQRESVRAAVDGLLRKGGVVLAGLLLIGAGRAATGSTMAVAVVGLCVALGVLLFRLKPAYVEALRSRWAPPPRKRCGWAARRRSCWWSRWARNHAGARAARGGHDGPGGGAAAAAPVRAA